MRDYLKRFISSVVKISRCLNADEHCVQGVILLYHSIGAADKNDRLKLRIDKDSFDMQMEYLHEKKYSVVPLKELISRLSPGVETENKKFIAITFDDGYTDNLEFAAPVLKKYGFPATVFIATGYLDGQGRQDKYWEEWGYLTPGNIGEIIVSGFEIGSPFMKRIRSANFSACFISSIARFSMVLWSFPYPQLSHISECTMYWLIAVSSSANREFKAFRTLGSPFIFASLCSSRKALRFRQIIRAFTGMSRG